jgi:low molecular weight protein-tyrosine phosphatase
MSEILMVCTGNVCRSPMAEGFLRAALAERLGAAAPVVSSAGTAGWEGSGAMDESIRSAQEHGVDIRAHQARKLHGAMLEDADLIVCMAAEHRKAIVGAMPDLATKTFTMKELVRLLEESPAQGPLDARVAAAAAARNGSSRPGEDVRDPLGDAIDGYREVADELHDLSGRLAAALSRDPR